MKKRIISIVLVAVMLVAFVGCTQDDWNYIIHKALEALGYAKQELTIESIDIEKTKETFVNAGLQTGEMTDNDDLDDFFKKYGIDEKLKPLSAVYAFPSSELLESSIADNIDKIAEIQAGLLLEYASQEEAQAAAEQLEQMFAESKEKVLDILKDKGMSEEMVAVFSVLSDFINIQAVDGKVAVYTTPAGELFTEEQA